MVIAGGPVKDAPKRWREQALIVQHAFQRFELSQRQIAGFLYSHCNADHFTIAKRHADARAHHRLRRIGGQKVVKQARQRNGQGNLNNGHVDLYPVL